MPAFATVHESCAHGRLSEPFLVSKAAILLASATSRDLWQWSKGQCIQLFRESLSQKMCTRQNRKVIWDMTGAYDQYTVPETVAVEPTFVAFL